jgi:hypothetical protein
MPPDNWCGIALDHPYAGSAIWTFLRISITRLAMLRRGHSQQFEDVGHLGPDAERGVQGCPGVLVDHRDVVDPSSTQLAWAQIGEVAPFEPDRAGANPAVPGQIVHDRHGDGALAAPRLADEAVGLPRADGEVDVADRRLPLGPDFVLDGEVLDFENRLVAHSEFLVIRTPD